MDLSELRENIVETKLKYRGFEINLKIKPDAATEEGVTNIEYLVAKLHDWDITHEGNKLPISEKTMNEMSVELFTAILNKVFEVVNAPLGK